MDLKPIPFGRYCILKKINKGGMAEIFLSRSTDKKVGVCVLKMLLPELAKKDNFINMFITEGKIAKLMNHPNVVQSYELGKFKDKYFIAMEYIAGKDLHNVIKYYKKKNMPVPIPMALYVTRRVLEGLDYAHNLEDASGVPLNLVNRDVSPTNILLTYDGVVKLIDFGIAQTVIGFTSQIGRIKGKICYMSPEQVR
ncbi:MAG: serine/threonine protein kinase, partial [Myxococcales bacterium]|nr:serine/threonine protein kinase [Myxococcales bacterium]